MSDVAAFVGSIPENYDRYMGPAMFEPYGQAVAARVPRQPGLRLLEVAAGTGRATVHLAAALPEDGRFVVTDLNADMLRVAQGKLDDARLKFQTADALELPFEDESFDAVVCMFGVMFFPDKEKGFREMARVLGPGGTLIVATWDKLDENPHAGLLQEVLEELMPEDPPRFLHVPYGMHDEQELRDLMQAAGLERISVERDRRTMEAPEASHLADGLLKGSPLAVALDERGIQDSAPIRQVILDRLVARFGDQPFKAPIAALFTTARKA